MNPFSKYLRQFIGQDEGLEEFVRHWDGLEAAVVRFYRQKQASGQERRQFAANLTWLRANYPRWQEELALYWPATIVAGEPATADPFLRLLAADGPEPYFNDWEALQNLPAAREALNQLLVAHGSDATHG